MARRTPSSRPTRTSASSRPSSRRRRTASPSAARSTTTRPHLQQHVQTFPGLVVAGPFGFSIREFFEVEEEAQRGGAGRRLLAATGLPSPSRPCERGGRRARRSGSRRSATASPAPSRTSPSTSSRTARSGSANASRSPSRATSAPGYRDIPLREGGARSPLRRRAWPRIPPGHPDGAGSWRARHVRRHGAGTDSGSSGTSTRRSDPRLHGLVHTCAVSRSHTTTSSTSTSRSGGSVGRRSTDSSRSRQRPAASSAAGGSPSGCAGDVELTGQRATLRAVSVPAHQVRRAADAHPALRLLLDARHEGRQGEAFDRIAAEEKADAEDLRAGPERIDRLKAHLLVAAIVLCARDASSAARHRSRVLALRPGAPNGLRSRVRAGAADGRRAGARARAPSARGRGGLVRVHRDACSTSFRRGIYKSKADDDRATHLGRSPIRDGVGPPALGRPLRI